MGGGGSEGAGGLGGDSELEQVMRHTDGLTTESGDCGGGAGRGRDGPGGDSEVE